MLGGLRTAKRRKTTSDHDHPTVKEASSKAAPSPSPVDPAKPSKASNLMVQEGRASKVGGVSLSGNGSSQVVKALMKEREMDMDEAYARNISRLGKHYKRHVEGHFGSAQNGADEDDQQIDMSLFQADRVASQSNDPKNRSERRAIQRAEHREANIERRAESVTRRCWWWMQSSSFQKFITIALGDHVSLVLVPNHESIIEGHCFLVPIKYAQSFRECDSEVWEEVKYFCNSLRAMFANEGKGVLFCETVLDTKSFWQARIDVIPVQKNVEDDAPMFFKSALSSEIEEFGTHTKIIKTKDKGLRGCIPKNFPYFNVEWSTGGFAIIIESKSFPKNFGVDTIASMMELDPLKFNRKRKDTEVDRRAVLRFCDKWKDFDWTLKLP